MCLRSPFLPERVRSLGRPKKLITKPSMDATASRGCCSEHVSNGVAHNNVTSRDRAQGSSRRARKQCSAVSDLRLLDRCRCGPRVPRVIVPQNRMRRSVLSIELQQGTMLSWPDCSWPKSTLYTTAYCKRRFNDSRFLPSLSLSQAFKAFSWSELLRCF